MKNLVIHYKADSRYRGCTPVVVHSPESCSARKSPADRVLKMIRTRDKFDDRDHVRCANELELKRLLSFLQIKVSRDFWCEN
jgi:hypothetical protein